VNHADGGLGGSQAETQIRVGVSNDRGGGGRVNVGSRHIPWRGDGVSTAKQHAAVSKAKAKSARGGGSSGADVAPGRAAHIWVQG